MLARAVGTIVDLPIDDWAVIDMDGFAAMIDELGGIDVYVENGDLRRGLSPARRQRLRSRRRLVAR